MVGALSVVGSSVVESHACPCLCVDAIVPTTSLSLKSVAGDLAPPRSTVIGRKQSVKFGSSESLLLSNTGLDNKRLLEKSLPCGRGVLSRSSRKFRKNNRRFVVVNELGGQYEDTFSDVKTQLLNYFTYKAVRTVLNQLYEMNPTQYRWFYDFVASNKPGDGKRFIRSLGKEKHELAERVMVTRLHLYGKWVKKCDHAEIYKEISDENLELMRERLMETVIWPSDDTNTEKIG